MTPKENLLRVIRHEDPRWVPGGMESVVTIWSPVVERTRGDALDAFGVRWSLSEGAEGGTYPAAGGHTVTDLGRWRDDVSIPDVHAADWDATRERLRAALDERPGGREASLVQGFVEMGLFERSYLLMGMGEALMAYFARPELMREMLAAIADYKIALIERMDDELDLDVLWYGDDWGTQDRLFMPPDVWRATVGVETRRIHDCAKARGIIVNQHSCGRIEAIFADVVEMGADMWCPCQPCNDLADLKRRFAGRVTFCGGIDSQFVLGRPGVTPDEVRAEVRKRIDEMAAGGGYIAAPSHNVPYDPELLAAMRDEIATYGRAYYGHGQRHS